MAEKVRTFVRGEGKDQSARLVRSEREAVQARWDGYRELSTQELNDLAKEAEKGDKPKQAEKGDKPK